MRLVLPYEAYNSNYIFYKEYHSDLENDYRFNTNKVKINILYSDNMVTMRGIFLLYTQISHSGMSERLTSLDNDIFNRISNPDSNCSNGSDILSKWDNYINGYKGGCLRDDIDNILLTVIVSCSKININSNVCLPVYSFDILSVG